MKESCAAHALIWIPTILKHRIPGISDDGQHRESGTSGIGNNPKWLERRWWPSTEIDGRPMNSNYSRRCHDDKFLFGYWYVFIFSLIYLKGNELQNQQFHKTYLLFYTYEPKWCCGTMVLHFDISCANKNKLMLEIWHLQQRVGLQGEFNKKITVLSLIISETIQILRIIV